jgi:hypothetical protein
MNPNVPCFNPIGWTAALGPRRDAGGGGQYPIRFMASRTRAAVSSLTMFRPFRTRDTVAVDTSASNATSAIVKLAAFSFTSASYSFIRQKVKAGNGFSEKA